MIISVLTFDFGGVKAAFGNGSIPCLPEDHPLQQLRRVWIGFDHGDKPHAAQSPLRGVPCDPDCELQPNLAITCADFDPDSPLRGFPALSGISLEPSLEKAESIVRFVLDWHDEPEQVVLCVHCRRGHFRSGAVAEWVSKDLGIEEHEASKRIVDCGNIDPPCNQTILNFLRKAAQRGEQLKTYTRWRVTDESTGRVGEMLYHRPSGRMTLRDGQTQWEPAQLDFANARQELLEHMAERVDDTSADPSSDAGSEPEDIAVASTATSDVDSTPQSQVEASGPAVMIALESDPSSFVPDGASGGARPRRSQREESGQALGAGEWISHASRPDFRCHKRAENMVLVAWVDGHWALCPCDETMTTIEDVLYVSKRSIDGGRSPIKNLEGARLSAEIAYEFWQKYQTSPPNVVAIDWNDREGVPHGAQAKIGEYTLFAYGNGSWARWMLHGRGRIAPLMCEELGEDSGFHGPFTLESAKAMAESRLRELHAAIGSHIAMTLVWFKDAGFAEHKHWTGKIGTWTLEATPHHWNIFREGKKIANGGKFDQGEEETRREAETTLRVLGVVFRVQIDDLLGGSSPQ